MGIVSQWPQARELQSSVGLWLVVHSLLEMN